jgi:hypothetical protein
MILGRIISAHTEEENRIPLFEYSEELPDKKSSCPVIVTGYLHADRLFNIKRNTTDKKIENNVWWTFSIHENRKIHCRDMNIFYMRCLDDILRKISYRFVNVFNFKYGDIKNMIAFMKSDAEKWVYIQNGAFIYLYASDNTHVSGYSIPDIRYAGFGEGKIINRFLRNSHIINSPDIPRIFKNREFTELVMEIEMRWIIPFLCYITGK